jgi:hypothetical protein
MITVSNGNLPTLQSTVPQPHGRRHGGGQAGKRWSDILQGNAGPGPSTGDEPAEAPVAGSAPVTAGGINILA